MADISLDFTSVASDTYKDFLVQNGDLVMTSDIESGGTDPVLQDCIQSISWIAGEWFLDIQSGVPFFQEIFVKNPDLDAVNAIFMSVLQQVPGVVAITFAQFTPNFGARSIGAQFSIQKTTGVVSYNGIVDY